MSIKIDDKHAREFISDALYQSVSADAEKAYATVYNRNGASNNFLGWLDLPVDYDKEEYARVKKAAKKIQKSCDVFVVIGIGGSYLGARAAIEFVKSPLYNNLKKETPDIYFAGNGINSAYLNEILAICKGKDVCINVISKSGKTTEPAVAFRIFRGLLEEKYGEEGAKERIFITTDRQKGKLKELADEKGYETFVVPDDIGGRYSVLTSVGLLPIAVAGIDIDAMMKGARDARNKYFKPAFDAKSDVVKYAILRNCLYRDGKGIEILVSYDPALAMFNEWWKQLYGESEGKDNKGLYPSSVVFSTDLHSLGQYIQQGTRNIFETVMDIQSDSAPVVIPDDPKNVDELNFLSGKTLHYVNNNAFKATLLAHVDGQVPNIVLSIKDRSAHTFGYLVYFFELACAISGYTLGVDPFNQPGVEGYKNNMYALLGKPGAEHEELRKVLLERLK